MERLCDSSFSREKNIFVNVKPSIIPFISCLEYNNDLSEEKIIN
jgi:hypothetical protein